MLLMVDINGIEYPEEIKDKINKQVTAHLDVRIKQDEARARKDDCSEYEARRLGDRNRGEEKGKAHRGRRQQERAAKFRAKYYGLLCTKQKQKAESIKEKANNGCPYRILWKRLLKLLKDQGQSEETIKAVLQNLASSSTLEDQLSRAIKITTQRQLMSGVHKTINSG